MLVRFAPRTVISLGDGFHDSDASARLPAEDRARLKGLVARHDWIWLLGNHDPQPPTGLGGQTESSVEIAGTIFRHIPADQPSGPEIAGHLHPCARVTVRGRRLVRPCFVHDRRRLLLPAFGSYTGGLDVFDPAIAGLFTDGFEVASWATIGYTPCPTRACIATLDPGLSLRDCPERLDGHRPARICLLWCAITNA